jgi:hypothetical protein
MNNHRFKIKTVPLVEVISGAILVALGSAILSNEWVNNIFLSVILYWKGGPPTSHLLGYLHLTGVVILIAGFILVGLFILPYWDRFLKTRLVLQVALKWDRIKRGKVLGTIISIIAISIIWILITVEEFSFSFIGNESDILPSILQVANHAWLPNDWYLNLYTSYRQLFGLIFGQLIYGLGFVNGAYIGRLIVYLLLAIVLFFLFKSIHLRLWYGILVLILFLSHQSLAAGEWVVYGLDAKTIAYAMVFLSFTLFLRKRYLLGYAFAGAAISFHVLVGIYALICILFATVLNKSWRTDWRLYIKNIWPFLITGIFGIWSVIEQLLPVKGVDVQRAWDIYVYYRVPQHVMPFTWTTVPWEAELAVAAVFFLFMFFLSSSKTIRFIAAFALGSVSLFLIGLIIFSYRDTQLLSYYWFRFPDVMVPFMSLVLVALLFNNYAIGDLIKNPKYQKLSRGLHSTLRILPPIIMGIFIIVMAQQTYRLQTSYEDSLINDPETILPAFAWISSNTPRQAIFLVDPTQQDFYIYAQRAMFVSWKSSPQSAAAILEWYKRIMLCNGNGDLAKGNSGISVHEIHTNYYKLDETQIRQIADEYGINYYVGLADQKLTFKRVYSDSMYAVYAIK